MLTCGIYLLIIGISILLSILGKHYVFSFSNNSRVPYVIAPTRNLPGDMLSKDTRNKYFIGFLLAMFPVVLLVTLRYGIGEDYFAYEGMYRVLHNASVKTYLHYHALSFSDYYVEPFYYIMNRIAPSYTFLQFLIFSLLAINLAATENEFPDANGFIVYIFLCCNFVYALNATRYVLGLSYVMLGIAYLLKNKNIKFFICIAIAALLHKTFLIAIVFFLIKGRANPKLNWILNKVMIGVALGSAILIPILMKFASNISIFSRYYSTELYSAADSAGMSSLWVMHILPVAVTLVFVPKEYFERDVVFSTLFRIYVLEVPFRFMAFYNVWYGRLARLPQVVEVFMIPLILSLQKNKTNKRVLTAYYIVWYLFYFVYYYISDGAAEYQWIFGR